MKDNSELKISQNPRKLSWSHLNYFSRRHVILFWEGRRFLESRLKKRYLVYVIHKVTIDVLAVRLSSYIVRFSTL